jgi:hypothetical protein
MKKALVLSCVGAGVSAGSIELVSGDLTNTRGLDNIKGKWSQTMNVFGKESTLTGEYDRNENKNFLKTVSLSGAMDKIKYELTSKMGNQVDDGFSLGEFGAWSKRKTTRVDFNFETETNDGTTVELVGDVNDMKIGISKVTASRSATIGGLGVTQDCDIEVSHNLADSESKLKLSSALGSGIKAVGTLTSKAGARTVSYNVEYDATLTEGRTLSASVNPADGSGEVEYEDSATLDATITATVPLGGAPKVTVKRTFGF